MDLFYAQDSARCFVLAYETGAERDADVIAREGMQVVEESELMGIDQPIRLVAGGREDHEDHSWGETWGENDVAPGTPAGRDWPKSNRVLFARARALFDQARAAR